MVQWWIWWAISSVLFLSNTKVKALRRNWRPCCFSDVNCPQTIMAMQFLKLVSNLHAQMSWASPDVRKWSELSCVGLRCSIAVLHGWAEGLIVPGTPGFAAEWQGCERADRTVGGLRIPSHCRLDRIPRLRRTSKPTNFHIIVCCFVILCHSCLFFFPSEGPYI